MSYLGTNKIGKMYLGSTAIGKAYLGNNLVFQQGGAQPVMIPYIRGGADGSYIDTGITADNTVKMIVWARNWNPTAGFLFGSRVATLQDIFGIGAHSAQNTGRIRIDYNQGQTFADDQFANLSHYHKYELYQGVLKVDDVVQASATDGIFSNNVNIHLLGVNTSGTHANPGLPIDICACQIYKNGSLVRDFTAVNSTSVGLYDAVSQTLFTNAGSGSFSYGEFNKNAYTPLEYIECTGAQYFDSGVPGTYEDVIVAQIKLTNTNAQFTWPFGVYNNVLSPDEACGIYFGNGSIVNARVYTRLGSNSSSLNIDNGSTSKKYSDKKLVLFKNLNTSSVYYNNTLQGSSQTASTMRAGFSTTQTMAVGTRASGHAGGYSPGEALIGCFYYCLFGNKRSFVPGKKGSRVGMYDTYNDVFYESVTDTPFIAGPTI